MKNPIPFLLATFVVITLLSSCSPAYIPNVINTPLLKEKGDLKANLNWGISGTDPQVAYAVTDNIGLLLNASFHDTKDADSAGYYQKHNFIELGAGYFQPFGTKGCLSVYGGYGFGNMSSAYSSNLISNKEKTRTSRFFIQPAIGFQTDFYEFSFSSRVVGLILRDINPNRLDIFIEPALTNKFGFKYGKFCVQTGLSVPINNTNLGYDYHPFMFSIGVEINVGRIIKRNQ